MTRAVLAGLAAGMLAFAVLAAGLAASAARADPLPPGFVRLSDLAPGIAQDIRYARSFNFTGAPLPGYTAATCVLTETTARALIAAEALLAADGLGLVVFDCLRPTRAVAHLVEWAQQTALPGDAADPGAQFDPGLFYPGLSRPELFTQGYIAARSSHSLGSTVDVGLRRAGDPVLHPTAMPAPCDAPFDRRLRETTLDMGTTFDCFSPHSGQDADLGPTVAANRARLTAAMQAAGFRGYAAEWWHFRNASDPARIPQDFNLR